MSLEFFKVYTSKLREAYEEFYTAVKRHWRDYAQNQLKVEDEEMKMIKLLVDELEEPEKASLGFMIAVGLMSTYGSYEYFYWLAIEGGKAKSPEARAAGNLQKLTSRADDPLIKLLVDSVADAIRISRSITELFDRYWGVEPID